MTVKIIQKPSFQAIGIKWVGTFEQADAGEIRPVMETMKKRAAEIQHKRNEHTILGISYHVSETGFTYYVTFEVEKVEGIPEGMEHVSVPEMSYASCYHELNENVEQAYRDMYAWLDEQGYEPNKDGIEHLEEYPIDLDLQHDKPPYFQINIPIIPKS